jgi:hypothetical protein
MDTAWVKTNTTRSAMLVDYYTPSDQGMPTHSDGARVYIVRWLQRVAGKVAVVFIYDQPAICSGDVIPVWQDRVSVTSVFSVVVFVRDCCLLFSRQFEC